MYANKLFKEGFSNEKLVLVHEKMEKSYQHLVDSFSGIRDKTIHPRLLQTIQVECYGGKSVLHQVALVTIHNQNLLVEPFDPSILANVEKAILKSNLGLNPQRAKTSLLVSIPSLCREQKQKLVKYAKKLAEDQKTAIRNIRRWARKQDFSDDRVNKLTKEYCEKIDQLFKKKKRKIDGS